MHLQATFDSDPAIPRVTSHVCIIGILKRLFNGTHLRLSDTKHHLLPYIRFKVVWTSTALVFLLQYFFTSCDE